MMKKMIVLLSLLLPLEYATAVSCAQLCKLGDYSACMMMASMEKVDCSESADKIQHSQKEKITHKQSNSSSAGTVWNLKKAEAIALQHLREHGDASAYGYGDIIKKYGHISMKHEIFAALPFEQKGKDAYLLVANSNISKHNDYRASKSKLSFFVYEKSYGVWQLAYEHIAAKTYAAFGTAPNREDVSLVQIGKQNYVLQIKNFMATLGWGQGDVVWYQVSPQGVSTIWEEQISENNGGTPQNNTDWKLTWHKKKADNDIYNDIFVRKEGKIEGRPVDKMLVYRFDGKKYRIVKEYTNKKKRIKTKHRSCKWFKVEMVKQLNMRNAPGKEGRVVDRLNSKDAVCISKFEGKWGLSDRGWVSGKYLQLDIYDTRNHFLISDIDGDGKNERLEWHLFDGQIDDEGFYQLRLIDDDGTLLWSGPKVADWVPLVAYSGTGAIMPVVLGDTDNDGKAELIIEFVPTELSMVPFEIYEWNGKKFVPEFNAKRQVLVWDKAPKGTSFRWENAPNDATYAPTRIGFAYSLQQIDSEVMVFADLIYANIRKSITLKRGKALFKLVPSGAKTVKRFR